MVFRILIVCLFLITGCVEEFDKNGKKLPPHQISEEFIVTFKSNPYRDSYLIYGPYLSSGKHGGEAYYRYIDAETYKKLLAGDMVKIVDGKVIFVMKNREWLLLSEGKSNE